MHIGTEILSLAGPSCAESSASWKKTSKMSTKRGTTYLQNRRKYATKAVEFAEIHILNRAKNTHLFWFRFRVEIHAAVRKLSPTTKHGRISVTTLEIEFFKKLVKTAGTRRPLRAGFIKSTMQKRNHQLLIDEETAVALTDATKFVKHQ